MQKQLTFLELVRLIGAVGLAFVVFVVAQEFAVSLLPADQSLFGFIAYLCAALFLPALLALLVACVLPSWRYKTIAATMMLMAIAVLAVVELVSSIDVPMAFLAALVRLSAILSGALVAALLWKNLKDRHAARGRPPSVKPQPSETMPKVSSFLLGLSLVAIPATYLTILESTFLVVGYSAVLLLILMELPRIPTVLLVAALLAPLVAGWASLRAIWVIFFPQPPFQAAVRLDLAGLPQTNRMIDEVCTTVGTRMPDHVILHAEPTFFVTQQKIRTFDGLVKGRTLAMGMPLLPHLTGQELKAILAHEFAHFSGRDTLYSVWVGQVYRSLGESIGRLQATRSGSSGCTQSVMNLLLLPSLLFLAIFYEFFAAIDAIVSRSRELRADWIAAKSYGTVAFTTALQKVVQYGAHFSSWTDHIVLDGANNIFQQHRAHVPHDVEALQAYLDKAMSEVEHEYDSHPPMSTRIASIPPFTPEPTEIGAAFLAELPADEQRLADAVAAMMQQMQAIIARYKQA